MSLFKRQPNKPKIRQIGGEDYYTLGDAASRLGIGKSTLRLRLTEGYYSFKYGKLGRGQLAPIYVKAGDIESYLRSAKIHPEFIVLSSNK